MTRLRTFILIFAIVGSLYTVLNVTPEEELGLARRAYSQGDYDQALRHGRRALLLNSDQLEISIPSLHLLSRAALKMNHPLVAEGYLSRLLDLDDKQVPAWLRRGRIRQESGKHSAALQDFKRGFGLIDPNKYDASLAPYFASRGFAFVELKQFSAAMEQAKLGLAARSSAPEPHLLFSKIYESQQQLPEALKEAELAWKFALQKNSTYFMTPKGRKLSDLLVDLRVKVASSR